MFEAILLAIAAFFTIELLLAGSAQKEFALDVIDIGFLVGTLVIGWWLGSTVINYFATAP